MASNKLPFWIDFWYILNAFICTWDASFILLRPRTLPGGDLHWFWKPYGLYIEADKRYQDMGDTFVYAVSLMNMCEVALSLTILILGVIGSKKTQPLAFSTAVMIWWKTVLYMLQYLECTGGGEYSHQNDLFRTIFILWIPNIIWIIVPFLIMIALWPRMVDGPVEKLVQPRKQKHRRD